MFRRKFFRSRSKVRILPAFSRQRSPGFSAAQIAALAPFAWYRFNQGITVATGVSQWNDQSGNTRHLTQATGSAQPTKNANGSILFDGAAHFLAITPVAIAQPSTFYILMKQVTWTVNDYIWDGNSLNNTRLLQSATTPNLAFDTGGVGLIQLGGPALGSYAVLSVIHNGASSSAQFGLAAPTTGNAGTTAADGFMIGARGGGLAGFSNIEVMEIILFASAHSGDTRAGIARYLGSVGGISP